MLGATHPNLVRDQGEAYRESLTARVRKLGIEDHVVFLDQFVDQATLLEFISMSDVYVTPYLNEAQMTSGTLAYSFGLGKPVVSTPYWHARELLADGRGVLVPFGDSAGIGHEIAELLTDDPRRQAMRERAYATSRSMTWERTAERYRAVFELAAQEGHRPNLIARADAIDPPSLAAAPDMQIWGISCRCATIPACSSTPCIRYPIARTATAWMTMPAPCCWLAHSMNRASGRLSEALTARFAAFVQHAWNPDTRRFRNFMGFNRSWLEDSGSADSHGRTLWALGECTRNDASGARRRWARGLFAEALPAAQSIRSPRASAFTLLGLDAYCAVVPGDRRAHDIRRVLADRLLSSLAAVETSDWPWFEEGLAYDNARLPQALIVTGMATRTPAYVDAGLRSLRWLMRQQTTSTGQFRPVGTAGFGELRKPPRAFDQQPLEATATISACLAAWRADDDAEWKTIATRVFSWFLGGNDLSVALVDPETGSCRDGLHPDRANENCGGESVVSYLLALAEIRWLARIDVTPAHPVALRAIGA